MSSRNKSLIIALIAGLWSVFPLVSGAQDLPVKIHLRGVYESKISLLALSETRVFKTITEVPGVKNGETVTVTVPSKYLPGEFILRFDYKDKESATPYPSEKFIFINRQDLELWVSPIYCNNPDSTWFQPGEKENAAFAVFSKENSLKKEKLGLLQQFLMNYDETGSEFYKLGMVEFEERRQEYNNWILSRYAADKLLFVSSLYRFQYIPQIPWEGNETDRLNNMISHYFDGMDFSDTLIIRTTEINKWMDNYVNLHGQMVKSAASRDSLLFSAATSAVLKAKQGNPRIYGWMVDYFFRGFESNNIPGGVKALEPYINDPLCLTLKKLEIQRRIKGTETLVNGSRVPDIELTNSRGNKFGLYKYTPESPYILLLFWSADCSHCTETVDALYSWWQLPENKSKISVVAVSLDETTTEISKWEEKIKVVNEWQNLRPDEGVNSKVANDFFILATPVMILIDAKTKEIISQPASVVELDAGLPR